MALNAIVRTNITAVNAHRQLSGAGLTQRKSSEKLASGQRINSAADDAAGLGIVEKMRAQISGLDRASLNAQDAMSLVQTAEGALSSIGDALIRMRELVIQAANDTNVHDPSMEMQSDRIAIQDEIDQLMFEINNIAYRTEFNTRTLLDGSLSLDGVAVGSRQEITELIINSPARVTTLDQFLRQQANPPFDGSFTELLHILGANLEGKTADQWIAVHGSTNIEGLESALDIAMGVDPADAGNGTPNLGRWAQLETATGLRFTSAEDLLTSFVQGLNNPNALRAGNLAWNAPALPFEDWADFVAHGNPATGAATFARAQSSAGGQTIYQALRASGFSGLPPNATFSQVRNVFYRMADSPDGLGGGWGLGPSADIAQALEGWLNTRYHNDFDWTATPLPTQMAWDRFVSEYLTADSEITHREVWLPSRTERERGVALWFHVGANAGQGILVGINAMTTRALGEPRGDLLEMIDVLNPSGRPISDQVEYLDDALLHVNKQRSALGAVHNRLEFAKIGLDISSENLSAAMSRIRDADMAKELMNFYSANVLTQAATAMIAHANQAPQTVLELLQ